MDKDQKIRFVAFREPDLDAGTYKIAIEQNVLSEKLSTTETLEVAGEQFSLSPSAVHALYPPNGTMGQYQETLPHISINKVTFPWERTPFKREQKKDLQDDGYPWMALIIIDESEFASGVAREPEVLTLADLQKTTKAKFPVVEPEGSQLSDDKMVVIDIQRSLLEVILPDEEELKTLAHVRKRTDIDSELAVLISNRLPKGGTNSFAHLVSLEKRYVRGRGFDYDGAGPDDYIRLVSLKSWSFASPIRYKLTKKALQNIEQDPEITLNQEVQQVLKSHATAGKIHEGAQAFQEAMSELLIELVPDEADQKALIEQIQPYAKYTRSFEQLIEDIDDRAFTLPAPEETTQAAPFIQKGFTALPHKLRQCDQTYSWYRGPLSPVRQGPKFQTDAFERLPDFADQLTTYYADLGMFNPSYAMAFQLGRLLGIQDKSFGRKMSQWKYTFNVKQAKKLAQNEVDDLLGLNDNTEIDQNSVNSIRQWMENKTFLDGIPFNYLVPDERFLPEESIRFFSLDRHWIECLQYGAFKLGGAIRMDSDATTAEIKDLEWQAFKKLTNIYDQEWTGFIIRSQLISGWPDLRIEGFPSGPTDSELKEDLLDNQTLPLVHRELLGPNVMICLFQGNLHTMDLYLKPEGLKFGVDTKTDGGFEKDFQFMPGTIDIPLKGSPENQVLDVNAIALALKGKLNIDNMSSAHYGMEMIDGSNKGRFVRTSNPEQP